MTDILDIAPGFRLAVGAGAIPEVLGGDGVWRRARAGDGAADALLRRLRETTACTHRGPFTLQSWTVPAATGERPVTVDQTNESVIVGDAAVVKWATHLQAGPHPAARRIPVLREAGFTGMPTPLGMVTWRQPDGAETVVATVDEYLRDAVDGWTWAVDLFTAAAGAHRPEQVAAPMTAVGALVADLHTALVGTAAVAVGWSQYVNKLSTNFLGHGLPQALSAAPWDPEPGIINFPAVVLVLLCALLLIFDGYDLFIYGVDRKSVV